MTDQGKSDAGEIRVSAAEITPVVAAIFRAAGLPEADADLVADSLVEADLRGVHSHGLILVPYYVQRLREGGTNATPDVRTEREGPAFAVVDGDNGMGQAVSARAMRIAIDKARAAGVGWVVCHRSNHFGTAAYWAMRALPERMIGYAATNALPSLFAWGGTRAIVGNNPLAYAIPAGRHPALVLDMALSTVAHGKSQCYAPRARRFRRAGCWMLRAVLPPTRTPAPRAAR